MSGIFCTRGNEFYLSEVSIKTVTHYQDGVSQGHRELNPHLNPTGLSITEMLVPGALGMKVGAHHQLWCRQFAQSLLGRYMSFGTFSY